VLHHTAELMLSRVLCPAAAGTSMMALPCQTMSRRRMQTLLQLLQVAQRQLNPSAGRQVRWSVAPL
jgi:hypothetical protein